MYLENEKQCGEGFSGYRTARLLLTLSEPALARVREGGGLGERELGIEEIDGILRRWKVLHMRAPFGAASQYEEPEIRRLARTFVVRLGRPTDLSTLRAELLKLDLVEAVEFSDPRFALSDAQPASAGSLARGSGGSSRIY